MRTINFLPLTLWLLLGAVAWAVAFCFLPDNPYQRWQLLNGTIQANARWIYERSHFDPTPIDVAIIGSSRHNSGINAPRLAADLAARGVNVHVVNFSLPESGRDINYIAAEQLFANKSPKLVVLGVYEKPSRVGHPAFKYVADRSEIIAPQYIGNLNYFSNLIYLPFRQLRLFIASLFPQSLGLTKTFDPTKYLGSNFDSTGSLVLPDGTVKDGEHPAPKAELERGVRKLEAGAHPPILPNSLADVEFGDERHYLRAIAQLAEAHGAKVAFLLLPYNTGPATVQEQKLYENYGPVWNAGFLASHDEWYRDYGHLDREGANFVTDWLAGLVAEQLDAKKAPK